MKSKSLGKVFIRPWTTRSDDIHFTLRVRNHPDLMKWFRQDKALTGSEQVNFMCRDIEENSGYNGRIIEVDGVPVGMCGVKDTGEFTIAILPEYQKKGISTKVMQLMVENNKNVWSEVFVGNPALEFFISKCGFKVVGVKEKAYRKKGVGPVDVVVIKYEQHRNQ